MEQVGGIRLDSSQDLLAVREGEVEDIELLRELLSRVESISKKIVFSRQTLERLGLRNARPGLSVRLQARLPLILLSGFVIVMSIAIANVLTTLSLAEVIVLSFAIGVFSILQTIEVLSRVVPPSTVLLLRVLVLSLKAGIILSSTIELQNSIDAAAAASSSSSNTPSSQYSSLQCNPLLVNIFVGCLFMYILIDGITLFLCHSKIGK